MATTLPGVELSQAEFGQAMSSLIPRDNNSCRRQPLSDRDIETIGTLLVRAGKKSWSTRPRTYAVLRLVDCLEFMQAFVVEGLTDSDLPFRRDTLPPEISDNTHICDMFLKTQWLAMEKIEMEGNNSVPAVEMDGEPKAVRVEPSKLSSPAEPSGPFSIQYLGPASDDSHERRNNSSDSTTAKSTRNGDDTKKDSLSIQRGEQLLDALRPLESAQVSSTTPEPTEKKEEASQRSEPPPGSREPLASGPDMPGRGSSPESPNPPSPTQEVRRKPLLRDLSNETRHPLEDGIPADPIQSLQNSGAETHTRQGSTISTFTGSEFLTTTSLDLRLSTFDKFNSYSPNIFHVRTNNRPTPSKSDSGSVALDRRPTAPGDLNEDVVHCESPSSSSVGLGSRSRLSFLSKASSWSSTGKATSVFSRPRSHLSRISSIGSSSGENGNGNGNGNGHGNGSRTGSGKGGGIRFRKLLFSKDRPLIEAAKSGDAHQVKEALRLYGEAAMSGRDGKDHWTALHWAASIGAAEACRVLLSRGMSTHSETKSQRREPLFLAVRGGHVDAARALLEADCNVKAKSKTDGATALHGAAVAHDNHRGELVLLLIRYGADVNDPDAEGLRPIHWAVQAKRPQIVETLVDAGADLEAKSTAGLTPLHRAVSAKDVDMARLLLDLGADVNATVPSGGNPLNRADATGNHPMIDLLTQRGAVRIATTHRRGGVPVGFHGWVRS